MLSNNVRAPIKHCPAQRAVGRSQRWIRLNASTIDNSHYRKNDDECRSVLIDRRSTLIAGLAASLIPCEAAHALDDESVLVSDPITDETILTSEKSSKATYATLRDDTLAYSFDYPVTSSSGASLPFVLSRKPEKYSSAAPLTADARQRIVCELVSLVDAVTVSVSVGNPAGTLRTTKQEDWTAKQLAEQVLLDRSTGRITSGQRISLATVEDAKFVTKGDTLYCLYEHISQGSPTLLSESGTTYRHARAVTAARPGLDDELYLYTLNLSCPEERWEDLQEPFLKAVESFTLLPPGKGYIPPNQDPWKFF